MAEPQSDRQLDVAAQSSNVEPVDQPVSAVMSPRQTAQQVKNALKEIYLVSGLGADERVFRLLKFEGYQPIHIHWVEPEPGESIAHYASRLATQIQATDPIVIGLSFGGMIAVEIAKQIAVERVILISSVKTKFEVPLYFRLFRWFPIHRIFPFKSLLWAAYLILYWLFGLESPEERTLLKAILLDTDAHFLKWALHKVVTWENETIPEQLYHIHGTNDRIFPYPWVEADFIIERGGHFMIMNRSGKLLSMIQTIIHFQP